MKTTQTSLPLLIRIQTNDDQAAKRVQLLEQYLNLLTIYYSLRLISLVNVACEIKKKSKVQYMSRKQYCKRHTVNLQKRDFELFKNLLEDRFATLDLIQYKLGGGRKYLLNYRLPHLERHRYIGIFKHIDGQRIYVLMKKGAQAYATYFKKTFPKIDWNRRCYKYQKNGQIYTLKQLYLDHALEINRDEIFSVGGLNNVKGYSLLEYQKNLDIGRNTRDRFKLKVPIYKKINYANGESVKKINGYKSTDIDVWQGLLEEETNKKILFIKEIDRSSETNVQQITRKKLLIIWEWWNKYWKKNKLDYNSLRVTFTTVSIKRRDNLCQSVKKNIPNGLGLFWFACRNDFKVSRPESYYTDPVWRTPKDDKLHSLLS